MLALFNDPFYRQLRVDLEGPCSSALFPIFRFCHHLPITPLTPGPPRRRRGERGAGQVLQAGATGVIRLNASAKGEEDWGFGLVVANNHSGFDSYWVETEVIGPRVSIGEIAFEQNSKINREVFIKHYFPALAKTPSPAIPTAKVVPLYFTSQDYDEEFQVFKGERFFDLVNHADIPLKFTHFGFNRHENISALAGLEVEQVDRKQGEAI